MFNPVPGGPGYLSLFGASFLIWPSWEGLPVATLPPAQLLSTLDYKQFNLIENTYVYTNVSFYFRFCYAFLNPFANLHRFLIYALSFAFNAFWLTPFFS
jgi:hypothetical protein